MRQEADSNIFDTSDGGLSSGGLSSFHTPSTIVSVSPGCAIAQWSLVVVWYKCVTESGLRRWVTLSAFLASSVLTLCLLSSL
jgi:hypothetical protein